MQKLKIILLSLFFILWITNLAQAEDIKTDNLIKIDIDNKFEKNVKVWEKLNINLKDSKEKLEKLYNKRIIFEWNITWEKTIIWENFSKTFKNFWDKKINLNIYKISNRSKELIKSSTINFFVYKDKILAIFDKNLKNQTKDFEQKAKELWILIDKIEINQKEIEKYNFKKNIISRLNNKNYLLVYSDKDFMFDLLSKFNTQKFDKKINIVWVSPFNLNILQKYLQNFTTNKIWINKAILLDETSKFEVLKQTNDINLLIEDLKKNKYNFVDLSSKWKINNFLFISKFENNLSNLWFSTNNIYIILTIPFILFWIIVFKHLIWLTPAWILIPTVLTLLFLKLWFFIASIIFISFIIINILLSKIFVKYSMHYTPKITMLITLNIIFFIIIMNYCISKNIITIDINDIMAIILFILVSERLINIIVSKEFQEYKQTLINTFIFVIISFIIFKLTFIKTIILSYPEIILLLIPLSFFIWRFTWLRITEYFRFKEVIKSIEE